MDRLEFTSQVSADESLRRRLRETDDLLSEAQNRSLRMGSELRRDLADNLEALKAEIERLPQFSLVRPATIEFHNLAVTLSNQKSNHAVLADEVATVRECIRELLADETFGVTVSQLIAHVQLQLERAGVFEMPCGHSDWIIEISSLSMRPFPCDASTPARDRPVALRVCRSCGSLCTHDLRALGVIGGQGR